MPKKLVRATIPMCPKCESKLEQVCGNDSYPCHNCVMMHNDLTIHWGYYVDDTVEEVWVGIQISPNQEAKPIVRTYLPPGVEYYARDGIVKDYTFGGPTILWTHCKLEGRND
jgi:hypothetical protein